MMYFIEATYYGHIFFSTGLKSWLSFAPAFLFALSSHTVEGVQWLSGRVLDSRPKGRWFEPHWRHCVVCLGKTHKS